MANILIFNPGSTPVPNVPTAYLLTQNTIDFLGRQDVLFNPAIPTSGTLQNTKVLSGQWVLLTQNDINAISGALAAQQSGVLAQQNSGSQQNAINFFSGDNSPISKAMVAFDTLVFQSINSTRSFLGLPTYSSGQLSSAINSTITGSGVALSDVGQQGNFPTIAQAQNAVNNLSGYVNGQLYATKPITTGSLGTSGQFSADTGFFYVCIGTNSWKRTPLSPW